MGLFGKKKTPEETVAEGRAQSKPAAKPAPAEKPVPQPEPKPDQKAAPAQQVAAFLCRKKAVTAGNDQMHIFRQPPRQRANETGNAFVCQKVKIVYEQIAGRFARQLAAQIVCQQSAARGIRGTGIVPQEIKALTGKGVLYAFPEDGEVVGIYADADDI